MHIQNQLLENFRWRIPEGNDNCLNWTVLYEKEQCLELLHLIKDKFGYLNYAATVSTLVKRIGYATSIILWTKICYSLDVSPRNIQFQWQESELYWLPNYYFSLDVPISDKPLEKWIKEDLLERDLVPLIQQLSAIKGVSIHVLWENVAVYWQWVIEDVADNEGIIEKMCSLSGDDFQMSYNPFAKNVQQLSECSIRSTCCLSYMNKNAPTYCATCPKKK